MLKPSLGASDLRTADRWTVTNAPFGEYRVVRADGSTAAFCGPRKAEAEAIARWHNHGPELVAATHACVEMLGGDQSMNGSERLAAAHAAIANLQRERRKTCGC